MSIKKLNVLGNVLYLAAHPDDENTRFISYCANEMLYNTAYLALTRGDGGQNLVGPEIREELGIIRTQELLAARRTDGGKQFFTRAIDFGYSKTSSETQEIWNREKVLADIVWVIRKFRPDVIVSRFPVGGYGGHGHHVASAELGVEAFEKAADKTAFPEQLKWVSTWRAQRIVVNTGRWWKKDISADDEGVVAHDIGSYVEELGLSCNELASLSRTMHKSQGFGSTGKRGEHEEFFEHLGGTQAKASLFEGYSTTWDRVEGSANIQKSIEAIIEGYDIAEPSKSIRGLLDLRSNLKNLKDEFWRGTKLVEVDQIIQACAGLFLEAKCGDFSASPGDSIHVDFELVNRSDSKITVAGISSKILGANLPIAKLMSNNLKFDIKEGYVLPASAKYSQPYWLEKTGTLGTYDVSNQELIGTPENDPAIEFDITLDVAGHKLVYTIPLIYKWNDPVKGEQYRPFAITPPVFVNFSESILIFADDNSKVLNLLIKSAVDNFSGKVQIKAPKGWQLNKSEWDIKLENKGDEQKITAILKPTSKAVDGSITAQVISGGVQYNMALSTIEYDHIPTQLYFPRSEAKLVHIDLENKGSLVGYIEGAGDVIPQSLEIIGYDVDILQESDLKPENLKKYSSIVLGIRALNTNERIDFIMPALLDYAKAGGTLILQYNTKHRVKTDNFAPYPLKLSRDRVTEEDAEVTYLLPFHKILNSPNKITNADFDGWVQERGLYFPDEWDEKYDAVLGWNDKGEERKDGSLLVAEYGEGHYIYTGISFFRELPAGVPGAYRLLTNIISYGN
ncbi:MAG TPA: PIG-L family deacetylase [Flavobacteriales bacterium]|nr:PIG-L family deacetylase [Flavobacteriales bacterium]